MPPAILLTDPIHPDALAALTSWAEVTQLPEGLSAEGSDAAIRDAAQHAEGIMVRRRLPQDLFEGPHTLRCVVRHGVGLDFIPVDRATAHRIPVGFTPSVNANAVAEYVFAGLLSLTRQLSSFDASLRQGNWARRMQAGAQTSEIAGRTLGVIGYGAIGQRIGAIARHGFGMPLVVSTGKAPRTVGDVTTTGIDDVLAQADVLIIACPLTPQTRGMVDQRALARMKPGAILVNVGRGPIVREDDLVDALRIGHLGGAVLDVFEQQPLPADSALRQLPNVLLTPHLAGVTRQAERAMGLLAGETLAAVLLRGERPANIANPQVFDAQPG